MKKYTIILSFLILIQCSNKKSSTSQTALLYPLLSSSSSKTETKEKKQEIKTISPKNFWVLTGKVRSQKQNIKANLIANTTNYRVWLKDGVSFPTTLNLENLKNSLEKEIHPFMISIFKNGFRDIDKDKKMDIFLTDELQANGLVDPADYTNKTDSNQADITYIKVFKDIKESDIKETIAHELQHLFRMKYIQSPYESSEYDKWKGMDNANMNDGVSEYFVHMLYGALKRNIDIINKSGFHGSSIFYNGNIKYFKDTAYRYPMNYLFYAYAYHISASNLPSRKDMIYRSTAGLDKSGAKTTFRAKDITGLIEFLKQESSNYQKLGSSFEDIFINLYGSFLIQTAGHKYSEITFSEASKKDVSGTVHSITTSFKNAIKDNPLESSIQSLTIAATSFSDLSKIDTRSTRIGVNHHYKVSSFVDQSKMANNEVLVNYTRNGQKYSLLFNYNVKNP